MSADLRKATIFTFCTNEFRQFLKKKKHHFPLDQGFGGFQEKKFDLNKE